ncbi:MAG: 4Fe-4S dicluster domain-containing protein [Thermodesulfobacteriota bacterium]
MLILSRDNLLPFLRRLSHGRRLVAPLRNPQGDTLYSEIKDIDHCRLDLDNQPQASLKPFFLPQQETIATYTSQPAYGFAPQSHHRPTIFFGVRSCDLQGINYLDLTFSTPGRDENYFARRQGALLITLVCNRPFANCFCNNTASGPSLDHGYDLQFTDLGDRFLVEAGRSRGEDILETWAPFFTSARERDRQQQYQLALEAQGRFSRKVEVEHACRLLAQGEVHDDIWQELAARCSDCGGCAYVCPTCSCFTIRDQPLDAVSGERLRCWDACTLQGFTAMAGGHNPVAGEHALKRRFLHKLKYDVARHGKPSCVGCGRCLDICFGQLDITSFIRAVVARDEGD